MMFDVMEYLREQFLEDNIFYVQKNKNTIHAWNTKVFSLWWQMTNNELTYAITITEVIKTVMYNM
jgi:hypothetical protein